MLLNALKERKKKRKNNIRSPPTTPLSLEKRRIHAEYTQNTRRIHAEYTQNTRRIHAEYTGNALKVVKEKNEKKTLTLFLPLKNTQPPFKAKNAEYTQNTRRMP